MKEFAEMDLLMETVLAETLLVMTLVKDNSLLVNLLDYCLFIVINLTIIITQELILEGMMLGAEAFILNSSIVVGVSNFNFKFIQALFMHSYTTVFVGACFNLNTKVRKGTMIPGATPHFGAFCGCSSNNG